MSTVTSVAQRRGLLDRILGRPAPQPAAASDGSGNPRESDEASDEVGMKTPVHRRADAAAPARHTWPTLTRRVLEVTRAHSVLAIDDQGLVLASTGSLDSRSVDTIGAHVALAFDLFERLSMLGKKAESVCAQFVPDDTWLTAIRMRPPEGGRITIAIVGPFTLVREDRRKIRDAFARLFE